MRSFCRISATQKVTRLSPNSPETCRGKAELEEMRAATGSRVPFPVAHSDHLTLLKGLPLTALS